jgi:hypothetical protein
MTTLTLPNSGTWSTVERYSVVTPLGIRFWDPVTDRSVTDGLAAIAYPEHSRRLATSAISTMSGVYAFHGLPGLRAAEYPQGDPTSPGSLPVVTRFRIEVTDRATRFLPVAFTVGAPFRGIYPTDLPTPPGMSALPGFLLFSSSTRDPTPSTAVVRAQLSERLDTTADRPAAYAVLETVTPDGKLWIGLADERGIVASLFPYPTFTVSSNASSLLPSSAIPQQTWPLTVTVRYQPSALSFVDGSPLPDLRSVLAQAPAAIWTARAAPLGQASSTFPATLVFGQELLLRSAQESVLLISPGSMP